MAFEELLEAAREVSARAYVPYSNYPVGAAAFTASGKLVTGCNVENASYGATLCAECGLISAMVAAGETRLAQFVCVNRDGDVIMPCGRCRQLLWEFGGAELVVLTPEGERTMTEVLPQAFGPDDLEAVKPS